MLLIQTLRGYVKVSRGVGIKQALRYKVKDVFYWSKDYGRHIYVDEIFKKYVLFHLNLQIYLATIQSCLTPAVGSSNFSTVSLAPYSCTLNFFSASCHSSTHSAAAAVTSSLIGKSVSSWDSSLLFVLPWGPHLLCGPLSLVPCSVPPPPPCQSWHQWFCLWRLGLLLHHRGCS